MTNDTWVDGEKKKMQRETIEHRVRDVFSLGDRRVVHTHSTELEKDEDKRIPDEKLKQTFAHTNHRLGRASLFNIEPNPRRIDGHSVVRNLNKRIIKEKKKRNQKTSFFHFNKTYHYLSAGTEKSAQSRELSGKWRWFVAHIFWYESVCVNKSQETLMTWKRERAGVRVEKW